MVSTNVCPDIAETMHCLYKARRRSLWKWPQSLGLLPLCSAGSHIAVEPGSLHFILTPAHSLCCGWFIQDIPEEKVNILKIILSVILRTKFYMNMCAIPNGFRDRAIFACTVAKLLIKKRYYLMFLTFIVQVKNFLIYNKFSKIPSSTSLHFATRVRTWHVARLISSWRSFMRARAFIMRSSNSFHVFAFLYTSLFIQRHKQ
jgi:hypothetical protein